MSSRSSSTYIVTRVVESRHKKRTYRLAVGPFPTRASATGYMQRSIRDYGYPAGELAVATLREPLTEDLELEV